MCIKDFTAEVMYGIHDGMSNEEKDIQYAKNAYTSVYGDREYVNFIFNEVLNNKYDKAKCSYYEEIFNSHFEVLIKTTDLTCIELSVIMRLNKGKWYRKEYKITINDSINDFIGIMERLNVFYKGRVDRQSLAKVIKDVEKVISSAKYKHFINDLNYTRYAFRELAESLVEKYEFDTNKMLRLDSFVNQSFMDSVKMRCVINELVSIGVARYFISERASRNRYGSKNGTSLRDNIGLTGYGWELYKNKYIV